MDDQYNIDIDLDEDEVMEMAGMAWAIESWPVDARNSPMGRVFQKIKFDLQQQFTDEQISYLERITTAIKSTFSQPSVERGMLQGGFQGLMERLTDELDSGE